MGPEDIGSDRIRWKDLEGMDEERSILRLAVSPLFAVGPFFENSSFFGRSRSFRGRNYMPLFPLAINPYSLPSPSELRFLGGLNGRKEAEGQGGQEDLRIGMSEPPICRLPAVADAVSGNLRGPIENEDPVGGSTLRENSTEGDCREEQRRHRGRKGSERVPEDTGGCGGKGRQSSFPVSRVCGGEEEMRGKTFPERGRGSVPGCSLFPVRRRRGTWTAGDDSK
jgi:hypothetical protein